VRRFRIVGAGFSGLTLAYYLKKASPESEITVVEKNAYVGGLLQSEETSYGVVEKAANALLDSEELRTLAEEINLELLEAAPKIKRAYIFRQGVLRAWPLKLWESIYFLYKLIKLKGASSYQLFPDSRLSVFEWCKLHLGLKATRYLVDPAMGGIYAAPIEELNAQLILGRFFRHDSDAAPRKRKKLLSVAPRAGMNELAKKLRMHLESNGVKFEFSKEETLDETSQNITVFCGSLFEAQSFLKKFSRFHEFFQLPMLSVSSTTLFYEKPLPQKAFGILYPRSEARSFLGTLLNACVFPSRYKKSSETWIRSRVQDERKTLSDIAEERLKIWGRRDAPLRAVHTPWDKALPVYSHSLEHFLRDTWPTMRQELKDARIYVHGNYLGKLGLSQVLLSSKELARELAGA